MPKKTTSKKAAPSPIHKDPFVSILTWCDYADTVDQRMNILRTFAFTSPPKLPHPFSAKVAIRLLFDDLQPPQTLLIRVTDFEGSKVCSHEVALIPHRTVIDRWVFQTVAEVKFDLMKVEYSLDLVIKESGKVIGSLPLPVAVTPAKK